MKLRTFAGTVLVAGSFVLTLSLVGRTPGSPEPRPSGSHAVFKPATKEEHRRAEYERLVRELHDAWERDQK